jgi:nucleotide-binding universal stress UspA family protein
MTTSKVILVGVDGSDGSRRALQWAIHEARLHGSAVEVVTAWPPRGSAESHLEGDEADQAHRRADETMRHVVDSVLRPLVDPPPVSFETVRGDAVDVLLRMSARASMLVIGSHGTSTVRHAALGSVSEACAGLADCPVVVVPPTAPVPAHDEVAGPVTADTTT